MDTNATTIYDVGDKINSVIAELMERVLQKVLHEDPFVPEIHHAKRPLYAALVPDEIFKGSHFERRFVTPFGHVWEQLALTICENRNGAGTCHTNCSISGSIGADRLKRIQSVLNSLEHPGTDGQRKKPNWRNEVDFILKGSTNNPVPCTVTCDLLVDARTIGRRQAFELKAPLPNSDQTKVSKEKVFKLAAMFPKTVDDAYFALAYNPYGARQDYAWAFPGRWFDMQNDECVLIGEDFWDLLGGAGTYSTFLSKVNELGPVYRERIYREYLGIEPPDNNPGLVLK